MAEAGETRRDGRADVAVSAGDKDCHGYSGVSKCIESEAIEVAYATGVAVVSVTDWPVDPAGADNRDISAGRWQFNIDYPTDQRKIEHG